MADIRIKDLATTAASTASDDFVAVDGSANGTRKLNAYSPTFGGNVVANGSLTASDLILGTSGPSAKSSIAARAARQGLVFDGTTIAENVALPAFGTSDFTFSAWVYQPTLAAAYLCSSTGGADDVFMYLSGTGTFQWWSNGVARATSSAGSISAGKWTLLTATRTGGTTTLYANGISVGSGADTQNITSSINRLGGRSNSTNILNGALIPLIYNRAMSAAEVVALYEAGVPAGSDYNTASNTSVLTGANSDFSSAGNWVVSGGTTISGGKLNLSNLAVAYNPLAKLTQGLRYKLTITIDSITAGSVQYYDGVNWNTIATTAGTYTVEFTCAGTYAAGLHLRTNGGNAVLDTALYYQLGLLLAPDAGQAGNGLTWYDTSGNAANITLPASGVTWNVPTSGKMSGLLEIKTVNNTYSGGALKITDQVGNSTFITRANGTTYISADGTTDHFLLSSSGAGTLAGNLTVSGTGTSSVRGTWLVGTSAFSSVQSIAATLTDTYSLYRGTPDGTGFEHSRVLGGRDTSSASTYASFLAFYTEAKASGTTDTSTEKMRLLANGNLLLGTTVNSGALLQVGTNTTTSAGGMIFGTDTRLYRANAGQLYLDAPASTSGAFWVNGGSGNASASINLYPQGTGLAQVSAVGANSLLLRTNNTTALTLDSSQRCILAGALRLNNAYTAGAPTATGYVTLQDSAGNTYKVLVGT